MMERNYILLRATGLLVALVGQLSAASPESQSEADWQDDRWNRMESGRFQASAVPLPSELVLKGLSIAIGSHRERTVCYDTATVQLKAYWSDGLLIHNSRRFGVVNGSAPAGPPAELLAGQSFSSQQTNRWKGFHVQNERVVLRYEREGREILESPWWKEVEGVGVLLRRFKVQPGETELVVPLQGGQVEKQLATDADGLAVHHVTGKGGRETLVLMGESHEVKLRADAKGAIVELVVPPGNREMSFRVGLLKRSHWENLAAAESLKLMGKEDMNSLLDPGSKTWPAIASTGIISNRPEAYTIDTLNVPYSNPWNALMFFSGIDFFPNGDAAICTLYGDVWIVKGIDSTLRDLEWHRFATGLFQPLGLQVVNGVVHVLGRDQITALHDLNHDGFADHYRNHSNLIQTQDGHNFVTSLQASADGSLYYCDPLGVHRVSPDGGAIETIATGWRNPNGMGLSPAGVLTVAPQQGAWTPSSQISEVKPGGYYGFGGPRVSISRPLGYDPPLCWIPHAIDNSGGSQIWASASNWGPLSGKMIHLSFGRCSMMVVLRDVVDGVVQGGVVPLRGKFLSGAMRGAVNPVDGQLYVVGTKGWQTSALRDGSLQRVRYTGKSLRVPLELKVHENGVFVRFAEPLDPEWAGSASNYAVEQWNYRYSKDYGSKDYSVKDPDREGRDSVSVQSVSFSPDRRSVFVELEDVKPVMQMTFRYNLRSAEGDRVRGAVYHTVNQPRPAYQP